jgi:hypothetical protein
VEYQGHQVLNIRDYVVRREHQNSEKDFEVRLDDLSGRLQNLKASSAFVWADGRLHLLDTVTDLRVKIEALGWMLRTVKHLSSPAREPVILQIRNSLDQLEKTFDSEECAQEQEDDTLTRM